MTSLDSFKSRKKLVVGAKTYHYFSLKAAEKNGLPGVSRLPYSLKVLLENLLRHEDGRTVTKENIEAFAGWLTAKGKGEVEIAFRPARVLMQDFTGVPAVVDLAAMRDAFVALGGDPQKINPLAPVDLVIDHSVIVDYFGTARALKQNVDIEYQRNGERYRFLKWGQSAFDNFRVVPPGAGICHQVNLEFLAQTVWTKKEKIKVKGKTANHRDRLSRHAGRHRFAYDNGQRSRRARLGRRRHRGGGGHARPALVDAGPGGRSASNWRANRARASPPPTWCSPSRKCCAKKASSANSSSFTATGSIICRSRIAPPSPIWRPNMARHAASSRSTPRRSIISTPPGARRRASRLIEKYAKAQGMLRTAKAPEPEFTDTIALDLSSVVPSLAGPKRPEGRVALEDMGSTFETSLANEYKKPGGLGARFPVEGENYDLGHGDVVIAAITSCTNTSNPGVLIGAGLLARNAVERGLKVKPWVKTSLAPGSQVVAQYLEKSGLQKSLDKLGFNLVGFGCTTCIGNSGPLPAAVSKTINEQ